MAEWARVVTFEADDAAIDGLVNEIRSAAAPPEGVPATRVTVLVNRSAGQVVVATRFASESDLQTGGAVLDAMTPPDVGSIRRVSVDTFEVLLERQA